MYAESNIKTKLELEAWAKLENPNVTIEEAVKKLKSIAGNRIIEIDEKNRMIKIAHWGI